MRVRDTLTSAQRAQFDALLQRLTPDAADLVGILELFMVHQVCQSEMFNEETRSRIANLESRLRSLEGR